MMKKRILVVEDLEEALECYEDLLSEQGYEVLPFNDMELAGKRIRSGLKYDIALIDLSTDKGNYDGFDCILDSKRFNPDTPVISVSGYTSLPAGADAYFNFLEKDNSIGGFKNLKTLIEKLLKEEDV